MPGFHSLFRDVRNQLAIFQRQDAVHVSRQRVIVRRHKDRRALFPGHLDEGGEDTLGRGRVKVAGRLVGDHETRIVGKRPGNGHALLLAARHLARLVIGPVFANGLYVKSRRLERGKRTRFWQMIFLKPRSRFQGLFLGVILLMLFMLWIRAAVLIYALFFGVRPFPGTGELLPMLLFTPTGWAILLVGSAVGALFAAFAFAVSAFSVPMLLEEETDALSAMGISMALVWNNLTVMLYWGAIVVALFLVSVLTGFLGIIVVFPLLGHATWHAYRAIRVVPDGQERVFVGPA